MYTPYTDGAIRTSINWKIIIFRLNRYRARLNDKSLRLSLRRRSSLAVRVDGTRVNVKTRSGLRTCAALWTSHCTRRTRPVARPVPVKLAVTRRRRFRSSKSHAKWPCPIARRPPPDRRAFFGQSNNSTVRSLWASDETGTNVYGGDTGEYGFTVLACRAPTGSTTRENVCVSRPVEHNARRTWT